MSGDPFSQLVLPLCLFVIMLGMGLSLGLADFSRVLRCPRAALVGLCCQLLVLPLVGIGLAAWLMPEPALAIGLVLLAACPGGATSNLVTYLARGDLALSVSLTACSSLLSVLSIPLYCGLAFALFADGYQTVAVPAGQMVLTLLLMTLLPVLLGMALRARWAALARRLETKIGAFGAVFMAFLVLLILYREGSSLLPLLQASGPAVVALNLSMLALGLCAARLLRLETAQATAIALETGIQNSTLAILIASTFLADDRLAVPAALYSISMYLSAGLFVLLRRRSALDIKVADA